MCWSHLKENLKGVKKEIVDCESMDGWHEQCQVSLKASSWLVVSRLMTLLDSISVNIRPRARRKRGMIDERKIPDTIHPTAKVKNFPL